MEEVKAGGARKPPFKRGSSPYAAKKTAAVKYDPKDDIEHDEVEPEQPKSRAKAVRDSVGVELPKIIEVRQNPVIRSIVPGSVWKCGKFKWDPHAFGLESEKLNEKIIEESKQDDSLRMFLNDMSLPLVYCVAGSPDDTQAKYFAAYLAQRMLDKHPHARIVWHQMYGGFDNKLLKEYDEIDGKMDPNMLIISNLTPNATNVKLEKVRDLMVRFADIPKILVVAGEDPLSFCAARLYNEVNALAYFNGSLMRKRIEVI